MYVEARATIPPLPPPISYETVDEMMQLDDWSFLAAQHWSFPCSGGAVYVAENW